MTVRQANKQLKNLGVHIRYIADTGEFRVNFVGGREATAYYGSDLQDAIDTAQAMAKQREGK